MKYSNLNENASQIYVVRFWTLLSSDIILVSQFQGQLVHSLQCPTLSTEHWFWSVNSSRQLLRGPFWATPFIFHSFLHFHLLCSRQCQSERKACPFIILFPKKQFFLIFPSWWILSLLLAKKTFFFEYFMLERVKPCPQQPLEEGQSISRGCWSENIVALTASPPPACPTFLRIKSKPFLPVTRAVTSFAHQRVPVVCFYWQGQFLGTKGKWPAASARELATRA